MSMQQIKAEPRNDLGKGGAYRIRKTGLIPGITYGKGLPSTPISVAPKDVVNVLKSERGKNTLIELALGGEKTLTVMIRDYTVHPVRRELEHVDFVEVKLDQPVDTEIPLIVTGKAVGVTLGGVLRQVYRMIPVRCTPDRIPVKVEVDVTHLKLGEHVAAQELKLGEGVSVRLSPEQTVVSVVAPEKDRSEEAAAPGAAGAAPAAGAAGAKPAAGGKAAPAKADAKKK
jgi:large subunit ribosomal protein L25